MGCRIVFFEVKPLNEEVKPQKSREIVIPIGQITRSAAAAAAASRQSSLLVSLNLAIIKSVTIM